MVRPHSSGRGRIPTKQAVVSYDMHRLYD